MVKKSTAPWGLTSALLVLAAGTISSLAAIVTVPPGFMAGDKYRLIFVTDGTRDATSMNIGDYNAFVAAEAAAVAELNNLGTTWTVIGSTMTVDARDNTGTNPTVSAGVAIYALDGVKIADNNADLWDGSLDAGISITPTGASLALQSVFTGTLVDGRSAVNDPIDTAPLGGLDAGVGFVRVGGSPVSSSVWISGGQELEDANGGAGRVFFAISGVIPEPSRVVLSLLGISAIGLRRCRR